MDRSPTRRVVALGATVLAVALSGSLAPGAAATPPAARPAARALSSATFTAPPDAGTVADPLNIFASALPSGYVQHEWFASGTASAYEAAATPSDGRWTTTTTTSAPYRTRIIVLAPADPTAFDGTVVVEWTNQSSGESSPDWTYLNPMVSRTGTVYVAVTAQALAVNGGTSLLGSPVTGLTTLQPDRYGTLAHPGDQYAYDIFDQVGRALRAGGAVLGGLTPERVVATGESQSAFFLTTYANTLQHQNDTYDAIFVHSRGRSAAGLDGTPLPGAADAPGIQIRSDLTTPVLVFETETDLLKLGYLAARQANTDVLRTWEVAGTSHADSAVVGGATSIFDCTNINDGPQHLVAQAAFSALLRWVDGGAAPPEPARLKVTSGPTPTFVLDDVGNVRGGVRTPAVDAPTSVLSGVVASGSSTLCQLFGSSKHFSARRLVRLYGTEKAFLAAVRTSLGRAVRGGYVLRADRAGVLAAAAKVAAGVPAWQ